MAEPARLELAVPVLGATTIEALQWHPGEFDLILEIEGLQGGVEAATERLYRRLMERSRGRHLCRIWNYVPAINAAGADGMENYRVFSRARAAVFEATWGPGFTRHLPAASAVGGAPDHLAVVALATATSPRAIENPDQVPAYEYPAEHGPRSPSFSRATCWSSARRDWAFISGTAAIKGHQTVGRGSLQDQVACTVDNLARIGDACRLGERLGRDRGWQRQFKVYLRRAEDRTAASAALAGSLFAAEDRVIWLHADICRRDLLIEIEATCWRDRARP